MDYNYKCFNNKLAKELVNEVEDGGWKDNELYFYPTLEDYAMYELHDGWYINYNFNDDYNGAPNPLDYIDMEKFGKDLIDSGDESATHQFSNDSVITTSYGW